MAVYSKNAATEPLWSHVCGFAGRERDRRWLLMPKAFIDDSGRANHSSVFVLAGFAAPVDTWIPFSEDWQRALDVNPPLKYFKSYEAHHCVGEFNHFSLERRNQRVISLCDVLDKYLPVQVYSVLVLDDFKKVIKEIDAPKWFHNPYFISFWMLMSAFMQHQQSVGFTEPVDFIFDDQAEKHRIRQAWDMFLEVSPPSVRPFIGVEPSFQDDKKIKPLQAADLMAWHTREWNEGVQDRDLKKLLNTSIPLFQGEFKGIGIRLDEKLLRETLADIIRP